MPTLADMRAAVIRAATLKQSLDAANLELADLRRELDKAKKEIADLRRKQSGSNTRSKSKSEGQEDT